MRRGVRSRYALLGGRGALGGGRPGDGLGDVAAVPALAVVAPLSLGERWVQAGPVG